MGRYSLSTAQSGLKTISYIDGREVRLHSAYDPRREAERAAQAFTRGRASHILVCGLALGYHVQALRDRFPECRIIVVEHDQEVVDLARGACPGHLENAVLLTSAGDIPAVFEATDMSSFRGCAPYFHRASYLLYKDFYDGMVDEINRYISSKLSDLLTRFEFEERWAENIFRNIHKIFAGPAVSGLFGRFRGYPGIIVSAGPSLRKNIDALAEFRDRALIVAVDTAFLVMARKGLAPHMVMTLDAQKYSLKHFQGTGSCEPVLVADLVSYPRITDNYAGTTVFSTTSKYYSDLDGTMRREPTPMVNWIERYTQPIGDIQSGGSVATSAFDLLRTLGCAPIIFVGQDLAYTGREIHCTGTYHNSEWIPRTSRFLNLDTINQGVIRRRKIKYVEAYGGHGRVISDYVFDLYRGWFEDSASKVGFPLVNATEGGARIRNTAERPLRSLVAQYARRKRTPGDILKEYLGGPARSACPLLEAMERAQGRLEEIVALSADDPGAPADERGQRIIALAAEEELSQILGPFLRKTTVYLARHPDISQEKGSKMLVSDIAAASRRLVNLLEGARETLRRRGAEFLR
jgi:hypothetical protein